MEIKIRLREKLLFEVNEYWFQRILTFIFLMASTRASNLFSSDISLLMILFFSASLYFARHRTVDTLFVGFVALFALLMCIHFLSYGYLRFSPMFRTGTSFAVAYLMIKLIGKDVYKILSDLIAYLSLISLPIFLLSLVNFQMVFDLVDQLEHLLPITETRADNHDIEYANFIIYTAWQPFRNQGFMWEPGAFGAILSIGIFFNMVYNRFAINWKLLIMVVSMITTVSTTAILLLGVLVVFYAVNRRHFWLFPVVIVAGILALNLDFVGEKIARQLMYRNNIVEKQKVLSDYQDEMSLGRFGSMVVDLNDLGKNYAFGVGFQYELRTNGTYIGFAKSNGLTDYLVKFGILGMLFFMFNYIITARYISKEVPFKMGATLLLINLMLAFSNPVLFTPLWLSFQIYYVDKAKSLKFFARP